MSASDAALPVLDPRTIREAGRLERDANASAPGVARLVGFCARELEEVRLVLAKLTEHEA